MRSEDESDGCEGRKKRQESCRRRRSFAEKCSHVAKKQRAKFYILRRCIAMLKSEGRGGEATARILSLEERAACVRYDMLVLCCRLWNAQNEAIATRVCFDD
nr:putative DVL [Ipomoea batatas]